MSIGVGKREFETEGAETVELFYWVHSDRDDDRLSIEGDMDDLSERDVIVLAEELQGLVAWVRSPLGKKVIAKTRRDLRKREQFNG